MKFPANNHLRTYLTPLVLLGLILLSSCSDPEFKKCKIYGFLWEGQYYKLIYSGDRLDQMVATDSHVDLKYDEKDQLISAYHYLPGAGSTPTVYYEYKHGLDGISQIDRYQSGEHYRLLIYYTSGGQVDYITAQEFDPLTNTVALEFNYNYTFNSDGNLINEYGTSPVIYTDYSIYEYDRSINPFMILAEAVNHRPFFPLGSFVRFPVGNYDISVANRFSVNNPTIGDYQLPSLPAFGEYWLNTYNNSLPTSIHWTYEEYGTLTSEEKYAFKYDCQ